MASSVPKLQLTPSECHQRLSRLARESDDLSINAIGAQVCRILMKTAQGKSYVFVQGEHYPTRKKLWNRDFVKMIVKVLKEIMTTIYRKMCDNDLKILDFDPEKLEVAANNVIKFSSKIYAKYVSAIKTCDVRDSIEDQPTDFGRLLAACYTILGILAFESRFEKHPSVSNTSSQLWNKLHQEESVQSLLEKNTFPVCPQCFANELKEDGHFGILDSCKHLVCAECAKKLFSVRTYQECRCPSCDKPVSAWTDTEHFRRFKTKRHFQTKMWLAARRVKSTLAANPVQDSPSSP